MGWMSSVSAVARMVAPIAAGLMWQYLNPNWVILSAACSTLICNVAVAAGYRNLRSRRTQPKPGISSISPFLSLLPSYPLLLICSPSAETPSSLESASASPTINVQQETPDDRENVDLDS